jgi:hypothetical protein
MKKAQTAKRRVVKELRVCIRESRKIARQINRKLESLGHWNKATQACKDRLIQLSLPEKP